VATEWNTNGNCGLVVGATYPEELKEVRAIVGDIPILVPGIGAQGGDVEKTVRAGVTAKGDGIIANSSRGIIFASKGEDFAEKAGEEAVKLRDETNKFRGMSQ
jgi:orotidine-5'-phosphate decarboxylase